MSQPMKDKTFSAYDVEQGKAYALARPNYHSSVYETITTQHRETGGQFDTILDIGCGPGLAVRSLAPHFKHAIGLDPSQGMIETARSIEGGKTSTSEPIRFDISVAESLGANLTPPVADGSVDLVTASSAAHWFDMPGFYTAAARVLKPGGSIALWGAGHLNVHPSVPNAAAIQAALDEYDDVELGPYFEPGNRIVRGLYFDLPLPWTLDQPNPQFDEASYFRKEWGVEDDFVETHTIVDMNMMQKILESGSPLVRWRQAHPDKAGTEEDAVFKLRRKIELLLQEGGAEKGKEMIRGAVRGYLLIIKRK